MAKNILKEAIADAKAVREVALANAKAALEEAFTPKLQSMLSAKLSEDLNEDYDDENIDEMTYEEDEDMDETLNIDETEEVEETANLDEEIDLEEILNELELEEGENAEETVEEAKDEVEETMDEAKDDEKDLEEIHSTNPKADDVQQVIHKAEDIYEEKEFNLDALLEEINNLDENNEDEVNEVAEETNEEVETTNEEVEETNEEVETTNEVAEETNEVVGVAAGIAGLVAAAGGLSAIEAAAEDPEFSNKYPKVAKALAMMQGMGKTAGDAKRMEETAKDEELAETKAALEAVTTELNEVNLLNSKLLYVNRIFKANTLDEAQKLRVVETLDNASNVKEAKLIYETIKDTFNVANNKKESFKNRTKSLKEGIGMASKAAGTSTAPKKEILSESNDMMTRFQKLANIKINQ